jgi:hypothetical protein
MMDPIENEFVNDEPLAGGSEPTGPVRKRRRQPPSVLEPPPRRPQQIGARTELFLRENPVPVVIGALVAGLAIGLAVHYVSREDEKQAEIKTPLGRLNWSFLSLPFLWPLFREVKEKLGDSADAIKDGVSRVKDVDVDRYTRPLRKRWKSWTR